MSAERQHQGGRNALRQSRHQYRSAADKLQLARQQFCSHGGEADSTWLPLPASLSSSLTQQDSNGLHSLGQQPDALRSTVSAGFATSPGGQEKLLCHYLRKVPKLAAAPALKREFLTRDCRPAIPEIEPHVSGIVILHAGGAGKERALCWNHRFRQCN